MSIQPDSNLVKQLNQIGKEQEAVIKHVEAIKEDADNELMPHLEIIEQYQLLIALEIEEIIKKGAGAEIINFSGS